MLILIWKGFGLLIPVSVALSVILCKYIYKGDETNVENMLFLLLSAAFCLAIGLIVKLYRNATCEKIVVKNEQTQKEKTRLIKRKVDLMGEESITAVKDTFFGLNFMIWSMVFAILGAVAYFGWLT